MKKDFVEKIHYYLENGKVVYTEQFHTERGYCCESKPKCRHCPYIKNNILIDNTKKNV
jgi:hypothetical protein